LAKYVNAAGGGFRVALTEGATYLVGEQDAVGVDTSMHQTVTAGSSVPLYNLKPHPLLNFYGLTKPLVIEGNGAKIKCAAGLKAGTFNPATGAAYAGVAPAGLTYIGWIAAPYLYMLSAVYCDTVKIIGPLELDGNIKNTTIGGGYGDYGFQVGCTGLYLNGNAAEIVEDVYSHHHAVDGFGVNGPGNVPLSTSEGAMPLNGYYRGCRAKNNGRQGLSLDGGRALLFQSGLFGETGYDLGATFGSNWGASYTSPGAGCDIEAETTKIRDVTFRDCSFYNSVGPAMVSDSGDTKNVAFERCRFEGAAGWSAWPNKPNMRFRLCKFVGPVVNAYWDATNPSASPFFELCEFTNDPLESTTGATYSPASANTLLSAGNPGLRFSLCTFTHAIAGTSSNMNLDEAILRDCTIIAKAGALAVYGRATGRMRYVAAGGAILAMPGYDLTANGEFVVGINTSGHAEEPWEYVAGGVTTVYPATVDKMNNILGTKVRGDADVTITAGVDQIGQRFTTTLTAARAVTLSTTGAKKGHRFRIARPAGGAFNLNVGAGPLKAMAAATWAEFEFDGAAWMLISAGSL
jgi:hypothetical protein